MHTVNKLLARIAIFFVTIYQKTLSPDKGVAKQWLAWRVCTHVPHCSAYGKQCLEHYGFFPWVHYMLERILQCTPRMHKVYDPPIYNIVFFSWAPIGLAFLEWLYQDPRFIIQGLVTMPDVARGRGMKIQPNIIKASAATYHINEKNVKTPRSLKLRSKHYKQDAKDVYHRLQDLQPDFLVVIAYGKIIPQHILDIPYFWAINVHGSLLPQYRWASPLQSVFLNKDKKTGITIMHMDEGVDTGDCINQLIINLTFTTTVKDLIETFKQKWPEFLAQTLRDYAKWRHTRKPQDTTQATHTKKIVKEDACVNIYTDSLENIYAQYKAYCLWPKIYFIHKEKRVLIEHMVLDQKTYKTMWEKPLVWLYSNNTWPTQHLHPAIRKLDVKPEGKKTMTRNEFEKWYLHK